MHLIKMKSFCSLKDAVKKIKTSQDGEKLFENLIADKESDPKYINNPQNQ